MILSDSLHFSQKSPSFEIHEYIITAKSAGDSLIDNNKKFDFLTS